MPSIPRRERGRGWWRGLAACVVLGVSLTGCLNLNEPTPSPLPTPAVSASPTATPSPPPRTGDTLVVVAPTDPLSLVPPATNETEALLDDLLYDTLYRLDETLTPQPSLAVALPEVSEDGKTWTIDIRGGANFHDGERVTADDVVFSVRIATSAACQLGRELCSTVADHIEDIEALGPRRLKITLDQPYSPFLAEALARLPIFSANAVRASTAELVDAARRLGEDAPDAVIARVTDATTGDRCFVDDPPKGCRLSDHRDDLERVLRKARLPLPPQGAFLDPNGTLDPEAYAGALLGRVATLAQVLTTSASDQHAAALGLLDATARPLGGGPYKLARFDSPDELVLETFKGHAGPAPAIPRIEVDIVRDPSEAATRLIEGSADWLLRAGSEEQEALAAAPGVTVGARPLPVERAILFNVREGRLYADPRVRKAFTLCLDRDAATRAARSDRPLATTPSAAGSWAMPELPQPARDPDTAKRFLDAAGWRVGPGGIRVHDGVRLSSAVAVRASRPDLSSFLAAAAAQLRECGIELRTEELDTVGDSVLTQLQWPNDFDTMLVTRPLGDDPDRDVAAFEGAHATTEDNPADANPGGYVSARADELILEGRTDPDVSGRRIAYTQLQAQLQEDVPFWPVWYDTATSAVSDRVRGPAGALDPTTPRYDWDVPSWSLAKGR